MMASSDLRFEEYKVIMEDTTKLSDRRQTINDIFVGINVLLLTAMGAIFITSRLTSWWVTGISLVIALFATLLNVTWLRLNRNYDRLVKLRIRYLKALEDSLRTSGDYTPITISAEGKEAKNWEQRGVYTFEEVLYTKDDKFGFARHEQFLIRSFILAYVIFAALVAIATGLVARGVMQQVSF